MEMPSASAAAFVATYFQVMVDHLATSALPSLGDIVLLPCDVGDRPEADIRKRYRDPNDVESSCHNLRAGARVFAGNLHPSLGGRPAATSRECAKSHILAAYLVATNAYRGDAFRKLLG